MNKIEITKNKKGLYSIKEIDKNNNNLVGLDEPRFKRVMLRIAKILVRKQNMSVVKVCPCCNQKISNKSDLLK